MACINKPTVFYVLYLALHVVFSQVRASNECFSDSDCTSIFRPYCCQRRFYQDNVCQYNCVGESCIIDSNCAPSESCCSGETCGTTCVGKSCIVDNNCAPSESCCSGDTCGITCVGKSCSYDGECAHGESCCSGDTCGTTCVGKSCSYDGDCATGESCCSDKKCKAAGDCALAGWIIAVIVISVIAVIAIPIVVVISRRTAFRGVIVRQPAMTVVSTPQQLGIQQGQPMYFQNLQQYPPPPHRPQDTAYPPEESAPPMAMTPPMAVKQ